MCFILGKLSTRFIFALFIRTSSDGTYYGMVMSVRPSVRPGLRPSLRPSQFSALFSYMLWHIDLKFCVSLYFYARKIKFKCHQFPSLFAGVMLLFSSPEPKAQVSYCHSAPSVIRPSVVCRPSVNFHIFIFFSRTAWWILMKLGRDEVLMVPYKCCCFSARSAQGRIQGGAKIGQRGSPSSRNFFFSPEGYSDKPNG